MNYLQALSRAEAGRKLIWLPPPDLTVSEWADEYRQLSPESSAEPGQWVTDRAPFQRGIMDAPSEIGVETIVVMSSAQVGKTEIINNIVGYHIDQEPAPMLLVQPTIVMGQTWSKNRLAPMLRDTPALKNKVKDSKSRDSGNTILEKTYQGGFICIAGANSAASLASRPCRIVLCDEVDRFPHSAGSEGDPVNLAFKRAAAFWNRLKILVSTPTLKGISRIEAAFESSDKRLFFVPCPHCKKHFSFKWSNFKWTNKDPETTHYICEYCGAAILNQEKYAMIRAGEWRPTAEPANKRTVGFHIWEAYSPFVRWSEMVADFLEAKNLPDTLKTWVNTCLGETFEEKGQRVDEIELINRAEKYSSAKVPAEVLVITMGVDVQKDRLEYEIVGWGPDEESWSLDYEKIPGDPARSEVWARLDEVLERRFIQPQGPVMRVNACCIDTGYSDVVNSVYQYIAPRQVRRVCAVKGHSQLNKPIVSRPTKVGVGRKIKLYMVGTDTAKGTIFARLRIEKPGPGFCHFPDHYTKEYYDGLTAEEAREKKVRGRVVGYEYRKIRPRNEPLDCRVYALAALYILNPRFKKIKRRHQRANEDQEQPPAELQPATKAQKRKAPRRKKGGGYVGGWRK